MTLLHQVYSTGRGRDAAPSEKRYTVGACAAVAAAGLSGRAPVLPIAGAYFPA